MRVLKMEDVRLTQGTPKTLSQAILNGCVQSKLMFRDEDRATVIRKHVIERLAQSFSTAAVDSPEGTAQVLIDLFNKISKEAA